MDQKYVLGILELDSQHDEIEKTLTALQEAVENKDRWHILHFILESLHEKLVFHFSFEEAVMQIFAYPEAEEHGKSHQEALLAVKNYKNLKLAGFDTEDIDQLPVQLFHEQILAHDIRFAAYIKGLKERLGIQ